ncbi:bromodomain-containing protein DDB_G0280777-like [Diaphorina citri]|uniref:Bromodomain-containing protein DDB_G0280777-like n=1 Tax=Diaphorina citri TaxID=121845 RepID=A0A3Q0JGW0_DIACI|nr:bromodomain-containing protein DDB_G0280777-like [Diaphorina citri]
MGVVSGLPQFGQRQQLQDQQPQSFQGKQSFQPQQFQGQQSFQPQQFQGQQSFAPVQYLDEQPHTYIPILSKSEVRRPDGTFDLKYQSADGQDFAEKAVVQRSQDNTGDVLVKTISRSQNRRARNRSFEV